MEIGRFQFQPAIFFDREISRQTSNRLVELNHVPTTNMADTACSSPDSATDIANNLSTSINPSPNSRTVHIQYLDRSPLR